MPKLAFHAGKEYAEEYITEAGQNFMPILVDHIGAELEKEFAGLKMSAWSWDQIELKWLKFDGRAREAWVCGI